MTSVEKNERGVEQESKLRDLAQQVLVQLAGWELSTEKGAAFSAVAEFWEYKLI